MRLTRKHILVGLAGFACVCVIAAVLGFFGTIIFVFSGESGTPLFKQSAISATLKWGRLAPFPSTAEQFSITTEGNMFTRAFHASFTAPPSDIEQWLRESPGTREVSPTTPSPGIRRFQIVPGGGAQRAEVIVDDTENRVSVYVCWS
jgi:hypothetical protein